MLILISGLFLWCLVHLCPSMAAGLRAQLITKIGIKPYKASFALLIILSIVMMVIGWRSIEPVDIYNPPEWGRHITYVLVLLTFVLFIAAKRKTNIKRVLRHPQLTGLVFWSIGHLLANGDSRSLVLFMGLGIWAVLEMMMINRRTGPWLKPDPVPVKFDLVTIAIGLLLYTVLFIAHPYIAGVWLIS